MILSLLFLTLFSQCFGQVPLIIDTDASFDVDDVVAICLAHALADRGEAEILAIVHDAGIPEGIGAVSVLNHYYGRDEILLGAYKGDFGKDFNGNWVRGHYVDHLVNNWDSPVKDSSQVLEATEAYRKVLSEAADHSVVISAIGFATNLAALLQTGADQYSELSGWDLVALKVRTVVWQGGWYPPLHGFGHHTYNWDCGAGFYNTDGCNGASEYAVNNMPPSVEMVYSDVGDEVITGRRLSYCTNERNPCRAALEDQQGFGNGRCSWDPVVTLRAVRSDFSRWTEHAGEGDGRVNVDYWGTNTWQDGDISGHKWLVLNGAWSNDWGMVDGARRSLEDEIDDLLCAVPPVTGNKIVNAETGQCLHVDGEASNPGDYTSVIITDCDDNSNNQKWTFSSGQLLHAASGKCLDMDGNNNNKVEVYHCFGAEWQHWYQEGDTIRNNLNDECLDIRDGYDAFVSNCNGSNRQNWKLE